jgi:RNA polymerase sigma-70 factor (ECF subfamily)
MELSIGLPRRTANMDALDDASLVRRCLRGDVDCYDVLVRRYQRQVYSLLYRMLGSVDDAEDLVQDTFIRAYNALHSFRQDASFLTWLYKIASNLGIDRIRARRTKGAASLDEEIESGREPAASERETSPEAAAVRTSVSEVVHHEIMMLPERYRRVVLLRHVADMTIEEIAAELNLPTGTVKTHLFRARDMLRDRLRPVLEMENHGTEQPA